MPRYAEGTKVNASRSREEVESLLRKHGAKRYMSAWDDERRLGIIQFELTGRRMRFIVPLPDPRDDAFTLTPSGKWTRDDAQAQEAYEQEVRRRWRALILTIKAKLESVNTGIETVDEAFLAQIVLPNDQTVGEYTKPQLEAVYRLESMEPMLELPPPPSSTT